MLGDQPHDILWQDFRRRLADDIAATPADEILGLAVDKHEPPLRQFAHENSDRNVVNDGIEEQLRFGEL